jgi:hypothetical protein
MNHLFRLLRDASALVEKESRDLRALNFARLRDFAEKKSRLLNEIERAISKIDGVQSQDVVAALEDLRARTAENEKLFAATKQGFADAKARLGALRESDRAAGFYGADGEKRRAPDRIEARGNL